LQKFEEVEMKIIKDIENIEGIKLSTNTNNQFKRLSTFREYFNNSNILKEEFKIKRENEVTFDDIAVIPSSSGKDENFKNDANSFIQNIGNLFNETYDNRMDCACMLIATNNFVNS
jgi:hypothetical protein